MELPPCFRDTTHLWAEAVSASGPYRRYCRRPGCGLIVEGPWDNPSLVTNVSVRKAKDAARRGGQLVQIQSSCGADHRKKLRLIRQLYDHHGSVCHYCRRPMLSFEAVQQFVVVPRPLPAGYPTLDHVVPKAKGGRLEIANLVIACHRCNNEKGDREVSVLRRRC